MRAAADLLDRAGPEAVTMRAIAAAVGVSHNAPYKHFPDKQALLAAVGALSFRELRTSLAAHTAGATSPLDALTRMGPAYLAFATRHPARYRQLFSLGAPPIAPNPGNEGVPVALGPELQELVTEAEATFALTVQLVEAAQRAGELPPIDPVRLAGLTYAVVHGLADLTIGGHARGEKGLDPPEAVPALLLTLLARH